MTAAAVGLSHSPLIGKNDPDADVLARVDEAVAAAKQFVRDFDPRARRAVCAGPLQRLLLQGDAAVLPGNRGACGRGLRFPSRCPVGRFCVGEGAGPGRAPTRRRSDDVRPDDRRPRIRAAARGALRRDRPGPSRTDLHQRRRHPLGPVSRIRALGTAIGEAAAELDKRVLFLGSGGLSHDPPVPVLDGAPPRVADALIEGHPPTPEQRLRGEERVVQAGRDYAAGSTSMIPINPAWDNQLLDILESGSLAELDTWTVEWMGTEGGGSAHEVRTWIAAFASLAATGGYRLDSRFYEAIPEWIAGFAVATASPVSA